MTTVRGRVEGIVVQQLSPPNVIVRGGGIGPQGPRGFGLTTVAPKTAPYAAAAGEFVPVDTTGGDVPTVLPAAPPDGTIIAVKHVAGTHVATVVASDADVFNAAAGPTSLSLPLLNQGVIVQYKAAGAIWYVLTDDLTLVGLDARYDPLGAAAAAGAGAQPLDADLTAIAALDSSIVGMIVSDGAGWVTKTFPQVKTELALVAGDVGLGNVTNDAQLKASQLDTDGTLAANSDTRVPSQKAVKTYSDQLLAAAHALAFQGVTDCSANPNYPAATVGQVWVVSVAGKIGGASGTVVDVGDMVVCTIANAGGTQAAVGADFAVVQANLIGAVTGPATAVSGNLASFSGTSGKVIQDSGLILDTDIALVANSDTRIPSQKAIKAYVDSKPTGSGTSFLVAASNASARVKANADFVCDNTGDEVEINQALAASAYLGGKVLLSAGKFTIDGEIVNIYDGAVLEGYSTGYPTGGASGSYATGAVTSGTLIRPSNTAVFINGYAINFRVSGNRVMTLAAALNTGDTTMTLTAPPAAYGLANWAAALPASGTVIVQPSNGGNGVSVVYDSIAGNVLTLHVALPAASAAANGAQVNYGARTLGGCELRGFSIDGFGAGSPYTDASAIFFQNFRGVIDDVRVVRWKQNGLTVDGGGKASGTLGGFDNDLNLYVEKCGGDAIQFTAGASDNSLSGATLYGLHPTLGRYLVYIQGSPGLMIDSTHLAFATDHALYGDARALKISSTTRFTDGARGGVYLIGTSAAGGGFDIRASFRDMATGHAAGVATTATGINAVNSATLNVADTSAFSAAGSFVMGGVTTFYTGKTPTSFTGCSNHAATTGGEAIASYFDNITIAPSSTIRGGYIDGVHNVLDDASAPQYLVNIANSNMVGLELGPITPGYVTPATKAYTAAVPINNAGTQTLFSALRMTATAVKTGAYTANPYELVPVDTTSGAVTVTLPTAPPDGTQVAVKHVTQGGTNAVTVNAAGSDVFNVTGGVTTKSLPLASQAIVLQYASSGAIWYVIADDLPLAQLDARYMLVGATAGGDLTGTYPNPSVPKRIEVKLVPDNSGVSVAVGEGLFGYTIPAALNGKALLSVKATCTVAPTGTALSFGIRKNAATEMLSTNVTVDTTKLTSDQSATPPVIKNDGSQTVATGDVVWIDCDQADSNAASRGSMVLLVIG